MSAVRVGITTAHDRAARTASVVRGLGGTPVHLPSIAVRPADGLAAVRRRAGAADRILVTSTRALDVLWPDVAPPAPVVAVGPVTADAVRRRGGVVVAQGPGGVARLLEEPSARGELDGQRVLYPRSDRSFDLASIEALVGMLDAPVVYRVVPVTPPDDPADIVVFASPSAVTGWRRGRPFDLPAVAIGPTTADALRAEGVDPWVPDRPTWEDAVRLAIARTVTRTP